MSEKEQLRPFKANKGEAAQALFKSRPLKIAIYAALFAVCCLLAYKLIPGVSSGVKTANITTLEQKDQIPASDESKKDADPSKTASSNVDIVALKEQIENLKIKLDAATQLIDDQNTKISDLEDKIDKKLGGLSSQTIAANKRAMQAIKKEADMANHFDISRLQVVSLTPALLTIIDRGQKVSVKPGQALPGGVVFLSYDTQTKVLKTSAGSYQVE